MCLIITGQANKVRTTLLETKGLLLDVFKTNPDGIGIMYGSKDRLRIFKKLPSSFEKARLFIERMPVDERFVAIHFRWTTHGDTDLTNCHPYTVVENEVALMHNGILSTGNSKDRRKSDTWHFIEDYLKESITLAPSLPFLPGYAALVRDFIGGSNRLVFMDKHGRLMILNKKEGLEHDGMWFSNTYAWTPRLLIENYKTYGNNGYHGGYHNGYSGSAYGMYGETDTEGDDVVYGRWQGNNTSNWRGSSQHNGATKSAIVHNAPALPDGATTRGTSSPAAAPAAAPATTTYTPADAKEDAEWERIVSTAHEEWLRDARATRIPLVGIANGKGPGEASQILEGQDAPEEGTQDDSASGPVEDISYPPDATSLTEALCGADVDEFDMWLMHYPQVALSILCHMYKAVPTSWCALSELTEYEAILYGACLEGRKEFLIDECREANANSSVLAEVICFFLNWIPWPGITTPRAALEDDNSAYAG